MSDLLAENEEGGFNAERQKRFDELMRIYERGLLRKARAVRR